MTERTIKTLSFSHSDKYEHDLMTYALDPARGKFGPYIKRLIERDRDGWQAQVTASPVALASAVPAVQAVKAPVIGDSMRKVAKGFL